MSKESSLVKIRVTVPRSDTERVRLALGAAGAGKIGNYEYCALVYPVQGFFRPIQGANPAIGHVGVLETVEEDMVEVVCYRENLDQVIKALKEVHPYEQPAIDVVPLLEM